MCLLGVGKGVPRKMAIREMCMSVCNTYQGEGQE